ncbi:MAG: hypothetical protein UU32_C0044G0007 [Candidatus Woesebacteria bacterium GW2011_GWB1_41_10]|uniref:Uncharacterized protein n=1 Tax=Candidatus Woesebacteria bacterium GW2011_GWB1_41_10 TaxID=1618577 RepID=A0A0G0WJS2_9BACT|nr:MAG: hypothetical protein UR98_C0018G0004 [Parcubacteria group bacterium GW2011_GWA1_36_12]KKR84660.1 MAG: hypothetical protein UU32_C0044G0007 [Candidatus Woesebacteria bacterium GW2011_GWB1_41_10]
MSGTGGGTIGPLIRENVPQGEDATVWDPTHPHGNPEHTDADIWKRQDDGDVERDRDSRVHIPTDPRRDPW